MQTEYFHEFVIFANYLNITRAASELNMSQSNLSKHLKQLERQLGVDLIAYNNNKLSLTVAGSYFLNSIVPLMGSFDKVVGECQRVMQAPYINLNIQQPPYNDTTALLFYRMTDDIVAKTGNITLKYCHAYRKLQEDNLARDRIHLLVKYEFGDPSELIDLFLSKGFCAKHLTTVPIGVWCSTQNPLANNDTVSVMDIRDSSVMVPNEPNTPLGNALKALCNKYGFDPNLNIVNSETQIEFYYNQRPNSIYILPSDVVSNDIKFKARSEMVFLPFNSPDAYFESFAVTSYNGKIYSYLEPFMAAD